MIEKNHQITELYRLLSIILIIFATLTSFLTFLYNKNRVTEIGNYDWMLFILLMFLILIGMFLLFIIFTLMFEYYVYSLDNPEKHQIWLLNKFRKIAYSGYFNTVYTAFFSFLLIFLGIVLIINKIVGIIAIVLWIAGLLVGNIFGKKILSIYKNKEMTILQIFIFVMVSLVVILLIFFTIWNYTILFTSNFDISYDKSYYLSNEDIYVQIYSKGILKPQVINISYHTTPLNYSNHPSFNKAPIYLVIPKEILKTDSWNSFLIIQYKYRDKSWFDFFDPITNRKEFVPVYKYINTSE